MKIIQKPPALLKNRQTILFLCGNERRRGISLRPFGVSFEDNDYTEEVVTSLFRNTTKIFNEPGEPNMKITTKQGTRNIQNVRYLYIARIRTINTGKNFSIIDLENRTCLRFNYTTAGGCSGKSKESTKTARGGRKGWKKLSKSS